MASPEGIARARAWLLAVLGAGLLLGIGQLARGAHYPSHTFWTAGICWAICAGADRMRWGLRATRPSLAIESRHPS